MLLLCWLCLIFPVWGPAAQPPSESLDLALAGLRASLGAGPAEPTLWSWAKTASGIDIFIPEQNSGVKSLFFLVCLFLTVEYWLEMALPAAEFLKLPSAAWTGEGVLGSCNWAAYIQDVRGSQRTLGSSVFTQSLVRSISLELKFPHLPFSRSIVFQDQSKTVISQVMCSFWTAQWRRAQR